MAKSPTIKVLIVDDHRVVREGLRRILENDVDIEVIGEARTGEEAVVKAPSLVPDVIIMDLKMPGMDGIMATHEIKQKMPDVNILVLTLYAEDYIKQAIEAGVDGYLMKDADSDDIILAIKSLRKGQQLFSSSVTLWVAKQLGKVRVEENILLTERESQVLELMANKFSNTNIAEQLHVTQATVKVHVRNILRKFGVRTRQEAVSRAATGD